MLAHNNTGWDATACPKCGCQRLDVERVMKRNGARVRMRICQNCGQRVRTVEKTDLIVSKSQKRAEMVK